MLHETTTFEEAKKAVSELYKTPEQQVPHGKPQRFKRKGKFLEECEKVFQYTDVGNQVAYIESQIDWESFLLGPCKLLSGQKIPLKVVAKKPRKRSREEAQVGAATPGDNEQPNH